MKSKPAWKSKTIIGIAIAALPQLVNVLAQSDIVQIAAASDPQVQTVVTIAGLLLAAYGRKKAVQPVRVLKPEEFPKEL